MTQIINAIRLQESLETVIAGKGYDRIFILTDTNTQRHCMPLIDSGSYININVEAGEESKSMRVLETVLQGLVDNNASRHSLLINLGGGVMTDLGGFAASIYKRGIDYINIPTTLLAMVDASVGGKTGIDFGNLKNSVGCFYPPMAVLINTEFLKTLEEENILFGYAEVLKHGLLDSEKKWAEAVQLAINNEQLALNNWQQLVFENVKIKERFVEQDPLEKGIRKALNLGHTFGHAIEIHKNLPHGYAVGMGLICELYLSCVKYGFPQDRMRQTVNFIRETYGWADIECNDYDVLIELMKHDKKNHDGGIFPVLLKDIGEPVIDESVTEEEVKEALDFLREG